MSQQKPQKGPQPEANVQERQSTPQEIQPGFCSATCVNRACLREEICKPEPKTSDFLYTCNLPKRFEYPHWFNGYGNQVSKQHPFYRTTSSEYGWYPPGIHSVPSVYFPAGQAFTNHLARSGMYRNYSLNTGMDRPALTTGNCLSLFANKNTHK